MNTTIIIILSAFFFVSTVLALGVLLLNRYVNDQNVDPIEKKLSYQSIQKLLAVLAHPDDEVMIAGTLAKLKKKGTKIHLLYLTHGEDGPTGGLVEQENLAGMRARELKQVASILQVDSLEILDFPDRYLNTVPESELEVAIQARIAEIKPDTVICFDQTIGLYGNTDHAYSGKVVHTLMKQKLGVKNLLVMTLPIPMIELAMKVSQTFKERYNPENGLPVANMCVQMSRYGRQKKGVIRAHQTQWQVMNDVQPLWKRLPYWIYYCVFSKEYFYYIGIGDDEVIS